MRIVLTALLAFAAGVLLMVLLDRHMTPSAAMVATPPVIAAAATAPAAGSSTDGADSDDTAAWPDKTPSPEQIIYAQPTLMHEAVAGLTPRVPGKVNLYLITFAGDGVEDVFRNEAEYAAQLFTQRFGPTAHTLVLANNPATLQTHPLANWSNLETALDAVSGKMDRAQDVLVLYMTTHGDEDHNLLVDMDPLPLDQIGADDLGGIFKKHPFKWKVVVVNACYSGGFIPDLRGAGTMVITAARSDRSSFGCGSDSDITYFGKAWLVNGLNKTDNFVDAFNFAKTDIATWEKQDDVTPSEPQIDIGSGIAEQLAQWRKSIVPGAAVPFAPAPAPSAVAPATGSSVQSAPH